MENSGPGYMIPEINSLDSLIIKVSDVQKEQFQNTTKIKLAFERVKREKVCFFFVSLFLYLRKVTLLLLVLPRVIKQYVKEIVECILQIILLPDIKQVQYSYSIARCVLSNS